MSFIFKKAYQFGFAGSTNDVYGISISSHWLNNQIMHKTININVKKYECTHEHIYILSYIHDSGMSQHQREMFFGCWMSFSEDRTS